MTLNDKDYKSYLWPDFWAMLFIDRFVPPLPFHQLVIANPLTEPRLLSIERRAGAAFARQFLIRSSLQCCSDRGQGWYFDHCWWSAGCLPPILAETPPTRWRRTCNLQPYQETKYPTKRTFQKYPSKKTSSWLLFPVYVIKKWNTQNMEMEMYWWLAAHCLHPPGTSWGNLQLYRETNEINKPMNHWMIDKFHHCCLPPGRDTSHQVGHQGL